MASSCPRCATADRVVEDTAGGFLVCTACGYVLPNIVFARELEYDEVVEQRQEVKDYFSIEQQRLAVSRSSATTMDSKRDPNRERVERITDAALSCLALIYEFLGYTAADTPTTAEATVKANIERHYMTQLAEKQRRRSPPRRAGCRSVRLRFSLGMQAACAAALQATAPDILRRRDFVDLSLLRGVLSVATNTAYDWKSILNAAATFGAEEDRGLREVIARSRLAEMVPTPDLGCCIFFDANLESCQIVPLVPSLQQQPKLRAARLQLTPWNLRDLPSVQIPNKVEGNC